MNAPSLTKIFLVYTVQKLVEQGVFDLDKPMHKYLKKEELEYDERYKLITPRMVLSHSSGLENWKSDFQPDKLEIVSNPGEKFVYSGEGYQYLAKVIEKIIGQTYEEYTQDFIFKPFGLKNSFVNFKPKKIKLFHKWKPSNYALGHNSFGNSFEKWIIEEPIPASGINTTAEDFAKLIIAIFNQKNLTQKTIHQILEPVVPAMEGLNEISVGMGFISFDNGDEEIITFTGSNTGFKAQIIYSVESKRGFVFLSNSDRGLTIASKLNQITTRLELDKFFKRYPVRQYPNPSIRLQNIFEDQKEGGLFKEIESLINKKELKAQTLNSLARSFLFQDRTIARRMLEISVTLDHMESYGFALLGRLLFQEKEYDKAICPS